jgi:hypothetical protein
MKLVNYSETSIHSLLAEAKSILHNKEDINIEKENLTHLIDQADFILEKHDHIYDQFVEVFTSMGQFDFSKRLAHVDNSDNFINFVVNGVNMINEEFEVKALHRNVIQCLLTSLDIKDKLIVITNANGYIYLTAGALPLAEINTRHLQDQSIRVLFTNHHLLEEVIKSQGSNKNISSELKTREVSIPVKVDVSVCSHQGKIESIIYIVKSE